MGDEELEDGRVKAGDVLRQRLLVQGQELILQIRCPAELLDKELSPESFTKGAQAIHARRT